MRKAFLAIDLKSFYASCEALDRGLDPFDANLVVADETRTNKTICLAVTPALRKYGISSRSRLFEVESAVREINKGRLHQANGAFEGRSFLNSKLESNRKLELSFVVAPPRMKRYISISQKIYKEVYLKHIAANDMFAYSIDEIFADISSYLGHYRKSPYDIAKDIVKDVFELTGITATAGIGENLYLAKVAMDVMAKKIPPDKDGMRIASLDIEKYRRELWSHRPITDFWMLGKKTAQRLAYYGLECMGDVCLFSLDNEDVLYREFGAKAEYMIDHAWGWESCSIAQIKECEAERKSLTTSQVLPQAYQNADAKMILEEMVEDLVLQMNDKGFVCDTISLRLDYDHEAAKKYSGETTLDFYGRNVPKPLSVQKKLQKAEFSVSRLKAAFVSLFCTSDIQLPIRRLTIALENLKTRERAIGEGASSLFDIKSDDDLRREASEMKLNGEINRMKRKYGRNILLKASSYLESSRIRERNGQIGGHKT